MLMFSETDSPLVAPYLETWLDTRQRFVVRKSIGIHFRLNRQLIELCLRLHRLDVLTTRPEVLRELQKDDSFDGKQHLLQVATQARLQGVFSSCPEIDEKLCIALSC